jgi:putative membrane protein
MGWWMLFGGLWVVLFWAILIGAIAWLMSRLGTGSSDRSKNALEIAKERYARGEISREEFERIRKDLGGPA